jgi:hypothetical protein
MNIENLKNMPIIGEDPVLVLGQDAPIDNELSKLARAVRSFQETLGSRAQEHVVSSITSRDEEDNANAAAAAAYWTATKAEFDTIHARRVQDIDDLTKTFSKQISELLGTSGITAATPQSVFGLIEALRLEGVTWDELLQADTKRHNDAFEAFQSDIVGDIDNPLAGLEFTGSVVDVPVPVEEQQQAS